ncbi:copper resistance CopC/CopD family protein [Streptomyces albus]|uniref:copper resistance CopC/CopD family protein n=1 Tax=Streptomyces albus TaxID=1888 RepID=UPI003B98648D
MAPGRSAARPGVLPRALLAALLGGLALLGVLATASPAAAHAALTGSDPAQGSVVRDAPEQVSLDFSEGVTMSEDSIRVLDPHGERADTGKIRDTGTAGKVQRTVSLKPGVPQGTYTVAWQAVSADSHPVSGAFTFSVGKPSKTTATVPQEDKNTGGGAVGTLYGIGRYAAYAGYVLLIGGAAFVLLCAPRAASSRAVQRLTVTGWTVLTAATLALLLLRNPYTGSGKLADVADLGGLGDVVATKPGAALVSRLLLLAAAGLFVSVLFGAYARRENGGRDTDGRTGGATQGAADAGTGSAKTDGTAAEGTGTDGAEAVRERRDLRYGLAIGGTVVAAGLAATWAMAEHASTGLQTAVAMPVDVLHLLAVALWLGGLSALFCLLRWGPSPTGAEARRFSRVAFTSVTVLAATGLYQSWRQVGTLDALTSTSYGQLLIVKVVLVAALVAVGWFSRRWTARLTEDPAAGERPQSARAAAVPGSRSPERAATPAGTARAAGTTRPCAPGRRGDEPEVTGPHLPNPHRPTPYAPRSSPGSGPPPTPPAGAGSARPTRSAADCAAPSSPRPGSRSSC